MSSKGRIFLSKCAHNPIISRISFFGQNNNKNARSSWRIWRAWRFRKFSACSKVSLVFGNYWNQLFLTFRCSTTICKKIRKQPSLPFFACVSKMFKDKYVEWLVWGEEYHHKEKKRTLNVWRSFRYWFSYSSQLIWTHPDICTPTLCKSYWISHELD